MSNAQKLSQLAKGGQTVIPIPQGGTGASTAAGARTNLGLGTSATTNSTAYATAAQGATADTAIQTLTSTDGSVVISPTGTTRDLSVGTAASTGTLISQVRNETGATLTKGTVVYISGAGGNKALVSKALANADATSAQTYGVIQADIPTNQNGYVVVVGAVSGINTIAYPDGTQLYLSGTTAGTYTDVKPYAPIHLVYVGVVTYSHATQGTIQVKIQNGYELDEIHNVSAQSPSNGQTIVYNSSNSLWEKNTVSLTAGVNGTLPIANGGTGATTAGAALTALGAYAASNPSGYTTNTGTVTSVGGTGSINGLTLTGTVTTSGNLTLGGTLNVTPANFSSQTANTFIAAPNSAAGIPTFRAIVANDIPTLNQNTTGTAANVTGVVAAVNGGTGQSSYAVGDIVYASTTTALSKLADVATGNALISGGVGVAPSYGKIGLTTHVSGTLPVANGGTGTTTLTANNVILGNGTSAPLFVAPGTSGNVLTSNGTTWVSSAGASVSAATPTALGTVYGSTIAASPFSAFVGYQAGNAIPTGPRNCFFGYRAGYLTTTGESNVALGPRALQQNLIGTGNVAIGFDSLYNNTANTNVAIGQSSLYANVSATACTAVGYNSLSSSDSAGNTAIGSGSGKSVTSGINNTFLGYDSGYGTSSGDVHLSTGSNNTIIGYGATSSAAGVSDEVTLGNTSIVSTRLRGIVEHNMAIFEQATISATAATGTIAYYARSQSVLYYTSNASANWTVNLTGASGVTLNSIMQTGQSMTVAFLVTQGSTAYYNSAVQVDGTSVTPKWQGGTAPTTGNASSVDTYVYTVIKTGSATFTVLASQTKFA